MRQVAANIVFKRGECALVLSGIWKHKDGSKDDDFLKNVTISHDKIVPPQDVQDLCAAVGWSRREPLLIARALSNSLAVVSAWEGGILVGFARATGDHVFNATVWDVAVRPSHQRRGIGRLVMAELLKELDEYAIPLVTLYADPGTDSFYRRFGFSTDPSGVRGMFRERG
jgi:ribosomal protein S18 acetylase RimI-like enzyme